jgi:hypothetical protein
MLIKLTRTAGIYTTGIFFTNPWGLVGFEPRGTGAANKIFAAANIGVLTTFAFCS